MCLSLVSEIPAPNNQLFSGIKIMLSIGGGQWQGMCIETRPVFVEGVWRHRSVDPSTWVRYPLGFHIYKVMPNRVHPVNCHLVLVQGRGILAKGRDCGLKTWVAREMRVLRRL